MRFYPLLFVFLLIAGCKSAGKSGLKDVRADEGPASLSTLEKQADFANLALPNKISYPFIKFSHLYGLPENDPLFNKIFYQNTKRYEYHATFLRENIARYKDIKNYEDLILPPRGGEAGASIKEITAGAIYHRPAAENAPETLAYEIYFPTEVSANGTVKTLIDVNEVARLDKILKATIRFTGPAQIAFVIPEKGDFFSFSSKLKAAGVNTVKSWEFHKAPAGSTTYVAASSYGYLRNLSPSDFDAGLYSSRDILIFTNVPLDVGPIAGVITEKPAAAHSHVMFRAQNLRVPGIYIPDATNNSQIKPHLGKLIKLSTQDDGTFTVETKDQLPNIESEAEQYWKAQRKPLETPIANLTVKNVKVWNKDGVDPSDIRSFGAKATNFAILDKALVKEGIDRSRYTQGFMIPFSFFDTHMNAQLSDKMCKDATKKCVKDFGASCSKAEALCLTEAKGTLRSFVQSMLAPQNLSQMNSDPAHRREHLTFTQRLIREIPLASDTQNAIKTAMEAYPNTVRMRLRSSTNAEDIEGLNGAGLYESKSACLGDGEKADDDDGKPSACRTPLEMVRMKAQADKLRTYPDPDGKLKALADEIQADITKKYPLSKAVRSVFASLWTERSFLTREYYGLDHLGIYMGMLSHPSFVDESVNGVAVVDFKGNDATAVRIEAQYDDISVTNPIFPDTTPESWTIAVNEGKAGDTRMIAPSTLSTTGKQVLSSSELNELTRQLVIAAKALKDVRGGSRYDLEFILDKDKIVLIKQGRPL